MDPYDTDLWEAIDFFRDEIALPDLVGSPCTPAGSDTQSSDSSALAPAGDRPRRRPIPRKGHTKSRSGCFNCKRRKVKCKEERPACSSCQRLGLDCSYPSPARSVVPVTVRAP